MIGDNGDNRGREAALEELMRDVGAHRYRENVRKAWASGEVADTAGGMEVIRHIVGPMSAAFAAFKAAERERTGRPSTVFQIIGDLPDDLVAYLTIREAMNLAARGAPLMRMARQIASAIEDEVRMAVFDQKAPALYALVQRQARKKSWDARHMELVFSTTANAAEIELPRWSTTEKIHIGVKLLDLMIDHTGLVVSTLVGKRRNQTANYISLSDVGRRWIDDFNDKAALLRPVLTPTVSEPTPWTSTTGGGYITHAIRQFPLVKRTFRAHVEALKAADMAPVYRAVNAIQETPWAINGPLLDVIEKAADRDIRLPGLPLPDPEPLPPRPFDIDTNEDALRSWKQAAKLVYESNAEMEGRRLELAQLLTVGREYRGEERIFFPHQLDFRGRVYAMPQTLQPQGSDRAKALLHFAEGKPVGEAGLRWLAIHGANVFGFDKASFEERELWAHAHADAIRDCAADPFANRWWTEADSPWCFLAWCFEWGRVDWTSPRAFNSHLPIALDGSCNGLQHFSAMLRDPIGGAAVNLLPSDKPQDIYQRVADRATERLRELLRDNEKGWYARGWIDFGLSRKITKRPVMVLPYGGTMSSCLEYTRAAVREQIKEGKENPFGDELTKAEAFLAGVVWSSIGDVVVAAREVMAWLQKVARVATKFGVPLQWTTPSGFVAHQEYRDQRHRRIESRLRGAVVKVSHYEDADSLDMSRQALAISPNFVHSMDAAAMVLTINRCLDDGITSFAMIHDSYGTHAADTERMAQHLRSAFVTMYEEHDVLSEFLESVKAMLPGEAHGLLPPPPARGSLELQQVQRSAYFFA